jgi:uncharacterized protein (TIGR00251 family)
MGARLGARGADWPDATQRARIDIRVMPRSSKNGIDGIRDGRIVIRVTAAPVDGAANDAVVATIAAALDLPRRAVRVVHGDTSRNKTIEITGLASATVHSRLAHGGP